MCEYAEELLSDAGIVYEMVDIDESEALIQQYHIKIPVLSDGQTELNWPFNAQQAQELLNG